MANALSQFAYPEHQGMEHDQTHNEQDAMGNALQMWLMGVKERTLHPLNALAQVSQQAMQDPTETALNWSNPMNAVGGGLAGIFAGKGAKTADIVMLDLAQKMKDSGVPDREIHAKTGWFFGSADGKPRFEIPDNKASFNIDPARSQQMAMDTGKAFDHPDLYNAYPDSANSQMYFKAGEGGSYSPFKDELTIGSKEPTSTALHEFQHAIQQREGFARGGNPSQFDFSEQAINDAKVMNTMIQRGTDPQNVTAEFLNMMGRDPDLVSRQLFGKSWKELDNLDPHQQYKRLAGEAEARLTQLRMNMTPEQRLKSYPLDMLDVPVDQQIVRYGQ